MYDFLPSRMPLSSLTRFMLWWQLQELFQHASWVTCTKEWRRMWPLLCHQWHSQRVRWPRCRPSLQCHKFNKSKRKPMLRFPSSIRPDPWNISEAVTSIAAAPSDCAIFFSTLEFLHLYCELGKKGSSILSTIRHLCSNSMTSLGFLMVSAAWFLKDQHFKSDPLACRQANNSVFMQLNGPICAVQSVRQVSEEAGHNVVDSESLSWLPRWGKGDHRVRGFEARPTGSGSAWFAH